MAFELASAKYCFILPSLQFYNSICHHFRIKFWPKIVANYEFESGRVIKLTPPTPTPKPL